MKKEYRKFMLDSNRIEGEDRINPGDDLAIRTMLLSDRIIKDNVLLVHSILGKYLDKDWVGEWRTCNVRVGNYFPPQHINVPYLMDEYFEKLPMMNAWTAHNEFEKIHPFQDLNGRVGRLIWLNKALIEGYDYSISFLQLYYYQTLSHQNP